MPVNERYVAADPYPWPYDGELRPANTVLVINRGDFELVGSTGGPVNEIASSLRSSQIQVLSSPS